MAEKKSLRAALHSRNPDLLKATEMLVSRITPFLWHSIATFPSGTSHTPEHTSAVESIASKLVPDQVLSQLSDDEIRYLILACHFHDLGMAGTEAENVDASSREHARNDHAVRIGERIIQNWSELGFADQHDAETLADICRGHRPKKNDGIANWNELLSRRTIGPDRTVRLRLVAALIYAADELHIGSDRAPVRQENWLRIRNEEALRHWKRHQSITGPSVFDGRIEFDVHVDTLVFEADLRKHVFMKAIGAIRDAGSQLSNEGITGQLRPVSLQWIRDKLWELTAVKVQSDNVPREIDAIIDKVWHHFHDAASEFVRVPDACEGHLNAEPEIRARIRSVLDKLVTGRALVKVVGGSTFLLNTEKEIADRYFEISRQADIRDSLFAGQSSSQHEAQFYSSIFGRTFTEVSLTPIVESHYGVNLATEPLESPVRTVLRSSPSAARMLETFAPSPSILVRRDLLRALVLAGTSIDLSQNPNLMLDTEFRHAIKVLSKTVCDDQPRFLHFAEELALIGGFRYEFLKDALTPSKAWQRELLRDPDSDDVTIGEHEHVSSEVVTSQRRGAKISLSQSLETCVDASTQFPYLILAGARAEVPIELRGSEKAPFEIKVTLPPGQQEPSSPPMKIQFAPGNQALVSRASVRSALEIDPDLKLVRLRLKTLFEAASDTLPLMVRLPAFPREHVKAAETVGTFGFTYFIPALSVTDIQAVRRIAEASSEPNVDLEAYFGDVEKVFARTRLPRSVFDGFSAIPQGFLDFFLATAPQAPLPFHLGNEEIDELIKMGPDEAKNHLPGSPGNEIKPCVQSVLLRIANADGRDISEELLTLSSAWEFSPFTIGENQAVDQGDFDKEWQDANKIITMRSFVQPDVSEMAEKFKAWAEDIQSPFPIVGSSNEIQSPIFKTRFEFVKCSRIDRVWYWELPIILRLSPMCKREQWEVEASYWDSVDQTERAEILRERIAAVGESDGNEPASIDSTGSK